MALSPVVGATDAALTCLSRWGVAKTTLDAVAREAGVSRATLYRWYPGGKDALLRAAVEAEVESFRAELAQRLAAAATREDQLVAVLVAGTRVVRTHPVLRYLLDHEPDVIGPYLSFARYERVLALGASLVEPWLDARDGEWLTRVVLSYALTPSEWFDLGDEVDARRFVTELFP